MFSRMRKIVAADPMGLVGLSPTKNLELCFKSISHVVVVKSILQRSRFTSFLLYFHSLTQLFSTGLSPVHSKGSTISCTNGIIDSNLEFPFADL